MLSLSRECANEGGAHHAGDDQEAINRDSVTFTLNIRSDILLALRSLLQTAMQNPGCKVSLEYADEHDGLAATSDACGTDSLLPPIFGPSYHYGALRSRTETDGHSGSLDVLNGALASSRLGTSTVPTCNNAMQLPMHGSGVRSYKEALLRPGAVGEGTQAGDGDDDEEMLSAGDVEELDAMLDDGELLSC
jgi:hypothetical protein